MPRFTPTNLFLFWLAFGPTPVIGLAALGAAFGEPPALPDLALNAALASLAVGAGVLFILALRTWLLRWQARRGRGEQQEGSRTGRGRRRPSAPENRLRAPGRA